MNRAASCPYISQEICNSSMYHEHGASSKAPQKKTKKSGKKILSEVRGAGMDPDTFLEGMLD